MRIICFRGKNNTGKSTTIRRILNEIFEISITRKEDKDFSLIFKHQDRTIGICSYGDDIRALEKWLLPLKGKCDYIICATRTRGAVSRYIDEQFSKDNVEYIECEGKKDISSQTQENNRRIAQFKRIFKD